MEIQSRPCVFHFAKVFMCCSDWLIVAFLEAFPHSVVGQIVVVHEYSGIVSSVLCSGTSHFVSVFYVLYRSHLTIVCTCLYFMYNINSNTRGVTKHMRQMDPTHWFCKKTHKHCVDVVAEHSFF